MIDSLVSRAKQADKVTLRASSDAVGKQDYNLSLASKRAASVKNEFVKKGVAPGKIMVYTIPASEVSDPISDRRVEIIITD